MGVLAHEEAWAHASHARRSDLRRLAEEVGKEPKPYGRKSANVAALHLESRSAAQAQRPVDFLDIQQPKELLQATRRLQAENFRLKGEVARLQSLAEVHTQRASKGRVFSSLDDTEELEDALEKSEEAEAVTSLASAELRKVLEESNEAAEDALSAAQVAVITEAVAFVGCMAGLAASWIGWKMDDSQLPPESKIPASSSAVPVELLGLPPRSIDTTARASLKPKAPPPQPRASLAEAASSASAAAASAAGPSAAAAASGGASSRETEGRTAVAFPKSPTTAPALPREVAPELAEPAPAAAAAPAEAAPAEPGVGAAESAPQEPEVTLDGQQAESF